MNWLIKTFLNPAEDAYEFAQNHRKSAIYKKHIYLSLFIFTSILAISSTLILSFLSTIKLAKLWFWSDSSNNTELQQQLLDNYVYITNTISATIALISSIGAFFAFKEGYLKYRSLYKKFDFEITQYDNEIGYYFNKNENEKKSLLIDRIFLILGQAANINKLNVVNEDGEEDGEEDGN